MGFFLFVCLFYYLLSLSKTEACPATGTRSSCTRYETVQVKFFIVFKSFVLLLFSASLGLMHTRK